MGLFGCLLVHGFTIAYRSRDRLGALIATGVVAMLAVQIFLNIGMTIGLVPIIGLPLPLMSYGGSALLSTLLGLAATREANAASPVTTMGWGGEWDDRIKQAQANVALFKAPMETPKARMMINSEFSCTGCHQQ